MASEGVRDWDEPLPTSSSGMMGEEEENEWEDQRRDRENVKKLRDYVQKMAYKPAPPPCVPPRIDKIASPKKQIVIASYVEHGKVMTPKLRRQRVKRLAGEHSNITTEQLEQIIKSQKSKERTKNDLYKRKQEVYYEMLTSLERQCRTQYLNVLIRKFATFIAKLATTMKIPTQLIEPYSRMQRGIFCNILLALGVQPTSHNSIYYTTPEALEYEVCHKLAHALLSLIIKALDIGATINPDEIRREEQDFEMDRYIKDRLMCAAEKKVLKARAQTNQAKNLRPTSGSVVKNPRATSSALRKCENFSLKTVR